MAYIRLSGLDLFDKSGGGGLEDALRAAEIAKAAGSNMAMAWSWNFIALAKMGVGDVEEGFRYMEDSFRAGTEGNDYFQARNAIFNVLGFFYPVVLTIVMTPIVLHYIGTEGYGIYVLASVFVGLTLGLAGLALLIGPDALTAGSRRGTSRPSYSPSSAVGSTPTSTENCSDCPLGGSSPRSTSGLPTGTMPALCTASEYQLGS